MRKSRRKFLKAGLSAGVVLTAGQALSASRHGSKSVLHPQKTSAMQPKTVLAGWYGLILDLVRHTPTYSPPVASRAFAYLGIAAYETVCQCTTGLKSLAGQLNGLTALPRPPVMPECDVALVLNEVMATVALALFDHTGPTGQRAFQAFARKIGHAALQGIASDKRETSLAYGQALARHILDWSAGDGGAVIDNMGFPPQFRASETPGHWRPTSTIAQQQAPLLPDWGKNRTFAMPNGAACHIAPPPLFSEEKGSDFYREALEVYETSKTLTEEQKIIARFWSDDPMLSTTPPGHWIQIALALGEQQKLSFARRVDLLARLGVAVADAFIGCWEAKFRYDLIRPITYIRKLIDPEWDSLLITPPFPEYPSGHSVQSGAAEVVMSHVFGQDFAFEDESHIADGLAFRHFASFKAAAEEAAISRLYGGIHFQSAIKKGLEQGRCIGAFANRLATLS